MTKLKIFGKSNPVVGVKEYYSIHDFFGNSTGQIVSQQLQTIPDEQIKWSVWVFELGKWVKKLANNKIGATVDYTFYQKSLTRKGIRMLVDANGEKAVLDVTTQKTSHAKILNVELLDANFNKPTKSFAYGDWIIARVYCVDMERFPLTVTLWEDDGDKTKQNTTNVKIEVKKGNVRNGKADVAFYLDPSHAWLANAKLAKGDKDEGKFHEYYVTAEIFEKVSKRVASKNADVPNPDYKPEEPKPKQPIPAQQKGPSKKDEKGIAKSENKVHDYHETKVVVEPIVRPDFGMEVINSLMTVNFGDKKWWEKDKCFCNKDFVENDVRKLVKLLKGSETIWEGQALRSGNRVECNINDKTFTTLTKELNSSFKKYHINTCAQKMHFLAQVCEETGTFTLSEETKGDFISSQSVYKGRGLLQLTGVKIDANDAGSHFDKPGPYQDYANYIGDQDIVRKPEVVSNNVHYCIDSAGWIWAINKKMTSNPRSQAITKWGSETLGKSLNELAVYEKNYFELISVLLNGRGSNGMPNGYEKRERNYNLLKTFFFRYNSFHSSNSKPFNAQDIVTYHIYANGKIERHIPKEIKSEYKQYYKYIYHDSGDNEHEVCKVKWFEIDKVKIKKPNPSSIPEGFASNESFNILGVNQKHVYKYSDGSIVASGEAGEGGGTIRLKYVKSGGKAIIVKVPDPLNYHSGNVKINLSFENTIRKYMGRDQFAAVIGALAECNLSLISEGSAMKDGTCFPSVSHTNGESIDSEYFNLENTQKYVNAMANFGITTFYYRPGMRLTKPEKATIFREDSHHRAHLHCGVTKIAVTEIKE